MEWPPHPRGVRGGARQGATRCWETDGLARFASMTVAAGTLVLITSSSAMARSSITAAEIAAGRLFVLGSTAGPRSTVILDGRFRAESDDNGQFQYELVYHPARCIVAATIDGKTVEAVVGNCSQQCSPPLSGPARSSPEVALPQTQEMPRPNPVAPAAPVADAGEDPAKAEPARREAPASSSAMTKAPLPPRRPFARP